MVTPMEEDSAPTGTSPPPPPQLVTQSVTDLLCAHQAMSKWKIVSSTHLLAQCHNTGCDHCAQYIVHLTWGENAGELSSQLPNLEQWLNEAWPEEMACICEDVRAALHSEIEEAHSIIDRHDTQMTAAKLDCNQLGEKYDDEVLYQQHVEDKLAHAEDKVACLQGQVHDLASSTTRHPCCQLRGKQTVCLPPTD